MRQINNDISLKQDTHLDKKTRKVLKTKNTFGLQKGKV